MEIPLTPPMTETTYKDGVVVSGTGVPSPVNSKRSRTTRSEVKLAGDGFGYSVRSTERRKHRIVQSGFNHKSYDIIDFVKKGKINADTFDTFNDKAKNILGYALLQQPL